MDFNDAGRVLDADTIAAVRGHADAAKGDGWERADFEKWCQSVDIEPEHYFAARNGDPVPQRVAAELTAVSVVGFPRRLRPNIEAIRQHLEWVVEPARGAYDDGLIEIAWTAFSETAGRDVWRARLFGLDELEAAADFGVRKNAEGVNVYLGATLSLPDTPRDRRPNQSHFYVATAARIDIDEDYDAVRSRMAAVCEDGLVVTTGLIPERRSHHWVRLVEPCADDLEFAHAIAALVAHTGADPKVKDITRLMRLGGTVNYPTASKRAKGYQVELTTVTVREHARPVAVEVLQALEPDASVGRKFDPSGRPAGPSGIVRKPVLGMPGLGPVTNGREEYFRDLLCAVVREVQTDTGLDPELDDLWSQAFERFSDPANVDNTDGRWTCPDGVKQLQARARNTLRRLRLGQLARAGLWSRETGANKEVAEQVQANREAAKRPVYAAGLAPVPGEPEPEPCPPPEAEKTSHDRAGDTGADEPGTAGPIPQTIFDPWARWPVPTFPLDTLPPVLRDFAEMQSLSTGADVSACAMAALGACSGAINHSFELRMKRTGEWSVRPRLWVMLVGAASAMKSPVISAATAPLRERAREFGVAHRADLQRWNEAKKDDPKAEKPPEPLRLISNDSSVEKLGEILSRQDRGILFEADELSGLFAAMDRQGGGGKNGSADRAFYLELFNGGSKYIDRIGRGETFVERCSASILGGIQPARLEAMGNLSTDGLLQRFLPVMMRKAERSAEVPDSEPAEAYRALVRYLLDVRPCRLVMDDAALEVASRFQGWTYDMMSVEALGESFISFLGKLNGLHGSLMLLLHMLADPKDGPCAPVSAATATAAARILREFVVPHALALYQTSADGTDWEYLRALASYVLTSAKDRFTVSDFTSGVHSLRGLGVWEVGQKVSPLVAGGWLIEEDNRGVVKAWGVVPGLRALLAERRDAEAARKAEVMKAYRDLSRGGRAAA